MGTVLATQYADRVADSLGGLPPALAGPAADSIGATYGVVDGAVRAGALPAAAAGDLLADADRAFMGAVHVTSALSAVAVAVAAVLVRGWLMHRAPGPSWPPAVRGLSWSVEGEY